MGDLGISGQNGHTFHLTLGDQQPVKGIRVDLWQFKYL
jgi:hypothetical protein